MADDDRLTNPQYVWNQLDYKHDALIEASAGTGKTYALESIVLKLVQEKGYDATSILLVTFTEKAAGELKNRIRKALDEAGKLPANFDEMTICTIHSFCRQLLSEYAFENGVPMKSEIGSDSDALVHKAVLEALKSFEFASLYQDLFKVLSDVKIKSIGDLVEAVEKVVRSGGVESLKGKLYKTVREAQEKVAEAYRQLQGLPTGNLGEVICSKAEFKKEDPKNLYRWLKDAFPLLANPDSKDFTDLLDRFPEKFSDSWNPKIKSWNGTPAKVGRSEKDLFEIEEISSCRDSLFRLFTAVKDLVKERGKIEAGRKEAIRKCKLLLSLSELAEPRFLELKKAAALLTFDDMVLRAAEVVTRPPRNEGEKLAQRRFFESIRRRYRVALVDEFQDTDQHQWDISRTLFSSKVNQVEGEKSGFLLVVGDPKQAIYSFRGADVRVYCDARGELTEHDALDENGNLRWRKTLEKTYRSKKSLVGAFNIFFRDAPCDEVPVEGAEKPGSDWFKDGAAGEGITYEDVSYPEGNEKFARLEETPEGTGTPVLLLESMPPKIVPSSSIQGGIRFGNRTACLPEFMERAAREMLYLKSLDPAPWIRKEHDEEKTTFSYGDMCVLVATNADAVVVRRILAKHGIPYGQYKQQGLYQSPEAEGVLALLDYLARPSGSGNRAALLLSPIFGIHPSRLSHLTQADDAAFDAFIDDLQKFAADKEWDKLFERVMSDPCTALVNPSSDLCAFNRTRAAVRQIFDALLSEMGGIACGASEFASILREWRKNDVAAGDDGPLFKKESEADRVQIMTMHASKGLEFPIVFVAYGFSKQITKGAPKEDEPAALEERRRLLYVAITRAGYRLYLPWSARAWNWDVEKEENQKDEKGKVVKDANGEDVKVVRQVACSGLGSAGAALLVGADSSQTTGFLGRAIQGYFKGKEDSAFAPERTQQNAQSKVSGNGLGRVSLSRQPYEGLSIPGIKSRRFHWDSFTYIPQGGTPATDAAKKKTTAESDSGPDPEPDDPTVKVKTLLPRGKVSGDAFHEIMEALCKNDVKEDGVDFTTACDKEMKEEDSPLMELIRKAMRKYSLANRTDDKGDGDTTEKVLLRMVQNALTTPIKIGNTPEFCLMEIPKKDRLAEVEFVLSEQKCLVDLPEDRDGALNGKIDLLVRKGEKVFVLDWKTNSLPVYNADAVNGKMDEEGYHLQYKIYSLAASEWLKPRGLKLGGVAYLFVRGGEVGERSGVFAQEYDESSLDAFRDEISKMGYFAGRKEAE